MCSSRRSRRATDDHLRVCTLQRPKDVATIGALRVTGDSLSFPCSLPPARPRADPTVPRRWQPTSHNVRARAHAHARTRTHARPLDDLAVIDDVDAANDVRRPKPTVEAAAAPAAATVVCSLRRTVLCPCTVHAGSNVLCVHYCGSARDAARSMCPTLPIRGRACAAAAVWLACRSCRTRSRRGQGRRASRQDTPTR